LLKFTVGLNSALLCIAHCMLMFRCEVGRKFAEQRRTTGSLLQWNMGNSLWWFI